MNQIQEELQEFFVALRTLKYWYMLLMLAVGCFAFSLVVHGILIPQHFFAGGLTGLTLFFYDSISDYVSLSVLIVLLNIPILFVGYREFSVKYMLTSIIGMSLSLLTGSKTKFTSLFNFCLVMERAMSNDLTIQRTAEAVESPLVINSILESGVRNAPEQEIVYADQRRMSYRDLEERVNRLAGALAECGVKPGDTVAVMDWDTHRYLEAFFAIPMMETDDPIAKALPFYGYLALTVFGGAFIALGLFLWQRERAVRGKRERMSHAASMGST